jgi:DNA-binding IclR family transcriptional regulator
VPPPSFQTAAAGPSQPGPRGIQSIEVGGLLLRALAHHGRPLALKDLAHAAGMAPAKAHPYLVSFGKLGLVVQEPATGRYGLGPLAMQLGLISLQQFEPVALATPLLEPLAQALGHMVALAVWGNRGPTIVRVAHPPTAVHVSMRHGTVLGLRSTASGRLFAARLQRNTVLPLLVEEARAAGGPADDRSLDAELDGYAHALEVDGLSRVSDLSMPGVSAAAAPVLDGSGQLVLALIAIGPSAAFDHRPGRPLALRLREQAGTLSAQLGWREAA